MKKLLILLSLFPIFLFAQTQHTIKGILTDEKGEPIENFVVAILNKSDSVQITGNYFNKGLFSFDYILNKPTKLMLFISADGFRAKYVDIESGISDAGTIILTENTLKINDVIIAYDKIIHKKVMGKDEYNIPTIMSKNTYSLYTLLSNIPGLFVNGNDVTVIGKGTPIYTINGLMPRPDEISMLDPKQISKITVDRMPSSKYSQSVVAVIDIQLKKSLKDYFSVRVKNDFSYSGLFGDAPLISINNKMGRLSNFVNYGFNYSEHDYNNSYEKIIYLQKDTIHQRSNAVNDANNRVHTLSYSPKYEINKNSFVDVQYTFGRGNSHSATSGNSSLIDNFGIEGVLTNSFSRENNTSHNVISRYYNKLNDKSNLLFNVGYSNLKNKSNNDIDENITGPDKTELSNRVVTNDYFKSQVFTTSIDYVFAIKNCVSVETGFGYSYINNVSTNLNYAIDTTYRSHSKEHQGFLYANLMYGNEKINYTLGLRGEYLYKTNQYSTYDNKNPFVFIPKIGVNYQTSKSVSMSLFFQRSMIHPSISQLNPNEIYLGKYEMQRGNPNLKPGINNSVQYSLSLPKNISVNLGYTYAKNSITQLWLKDEKNNKIVNFTFENINKSELLAVISWWNSYDFYTIMLDYSYYQPFANLPFNGNKKHYSNISHVIYMQNSFKVKKKLTFNLSLKYNSEGYSPPSFSHQIYSLSVGAYFPYKDFRFSINGVDLINSNGMKMTTTYGNVSSYMNNRWSQRKIVFGITYNINNFKDIFKKNDSNADVLNRAK